MNDSKIFVLDTNVVLYDFNSIYSFSNSNVVIPITILEELDNFKKGNEMINYNAREFTRELDSLAGDNLLSEGVVINEGGFLKVETDSQISPDLKKVFWEDKPDHRILSTAYNLGTKYGNERIVLVSKDINLRMKAKSVGVQAEDYETGKIESIDQLYMGKNLIENVRDDVIEALFHEGQIDLAKTGLDIDPCPNEFFILRNPTKSVLAKYVKYDRSLRSVPKKDAYGITPRNAEQTFSLDALTNPAVQLVTLSGKAGTGKTLMALAGGLSIAERYKKILLARPIVPLSNRDLGFLPGDVNSKIDPYMQPLYDNLGVIKHQFEEGSFEYQEINSMLSNNDLQIIPLAYIRGRSLSNMFFIVDEAQNLTPHEVKTIITRAGEGTKIVFTGDPYQIDTPYLDSRSNGLTMLIDRMKGQDIYAHVTLEKGERSHLAELASDLL